jgi:hypothetical protein
VVAGDKEPKHIHAICRKGRFATAFSIVCRMGFKVSYLDPKIIIGCQTHTMFVTHNHEFHQAGQSLDYAHTVQYVDVHGDNLCGQVSGLFR